MNSRASKDLKVINRPRLVAPNRKNKVVLGSALLSNRANCCRLRIAYFVNEMDRCRVGQGLSLSLACAKQKQQA